MHAAKQRKHSNVGFAGGRSSSLTILSDENRKGGVPVVDPEEHVIDGPRDHL